MRTFELQDNDLAFDTDRNIVFIEGEKEITQSLERLFTTDAGEWFLNPNHGLEYAKIRGKYTTNEQMQMAVIKAGLQEARVREIAGIEIEKDTNKRIIDITFICRIDTGAEIRVPFSF
ncbi:MAG: hypothetical protein FWD01_03120 [Defluviitaleaceae bacterium]|nr:hypothetical protein [Defluviitaleaceae bacterium]